MDFEYFSLIVGYISICYISLRCLCLMWTMFRCYYVTSMGFVKDLRKYGEWVVVTGATDGIGKEYARQFAKQGFKIVLISRSKSKLENVAKEIEDEFHMETKIVCFDFTQTDGYDDIEKVLCGLDIGILVNNVGMAYGKYDEYINSDINKLDNIIHCNVFSDVHMTHMVSKGMLERKRGAILHISSASIYVDVPYSNIYPGTKIFMKKFFRSLQLEHSGVIYHQLVTPAFVTTNMSGTEVSFTSPTAEDYVKSAIQTIGLMDFTCGCFVHEVQIMFVLLMPKVLVTCALKMLRYKKKEE